MKKSLLSLSLLFVGLISFTALSFHGGNHFKADLNSSKIVWTATKVTGSHTGTIKLSGGMLGADAGKLTEGYFEVDMNTIVCTDITDEGMNNKLIGHLKSDDFFSVAKHQRARFDLVSAKVISGDRYELNGKLTIKGITQPITFPATVKISDNAIITVGTLKVDRTKFKIEYASKSVVENIGDKAIDDIFELQLNLAAIKS